MSFEINIGPGKFLNTGKPLKEIKLRKDWTIYAKILKASKKNKMSNSLTKDLKYAKIC